MRRFTVVAFVLCSAVSFLVGVNVSGSRTGPAIAAGPVREPAISLPASTHSAPVTAGGVDFADVAELVNASVVNIDAASRLGGERRRRGIDGPADAPREFETPHQGSGSGFVIDRQGFILTNFHVIEDADRITVTLADGRALKAEVVGTDPAIDVALIKVSASAPLEAAPLGDSDELRVGEWVCAIGNPLGYVHSVTVGVVSFIGRKLFDASLDDYIQTDAAINFGNSGGPLINARGQVIGINSALSSRASNIGFAVPINQAVAILPQLKSRGRVSRGFIGVVLTDVTPDLQRSLRLPVAREELIRDISGRLPGTAARFEILRDGRRQTSQIKLTERPRDLSAAAPPGPPVRRPPASIAGDAPLGLTVRDLDAAFARRMELPASVAGVVVTRVDPAGASFVPAMRRGFVIMEINRQPVRSVADYDRLVAAARTGDVLAFYGYDPSVGQRGFVLATVDSR